MPQTSKLLRKRVEKDKRRIFVLSLDAVDALERLEFFIPASSSHADNHLITPRGVAFLYAASALDWTVVKIGETMFLTALDPEILTNLKAAIHFLAFDDEARTALTSIVQNHIPVLMGLNQFHESEGGDGGGIGDKDADNDNEGEGDNEENEDDSDLDEGDGGIAGICSPECPLQEWLDSNPNDKAKLFKLGSLCKEAMGPRGDLSSDLRMDLVQNLAKHWLTADERLALVTNIARGAPHPVKGVSESKARSIERTNLRRRERQKEVMVAMAPLDAQGNVITVLFKQDTMAILVKNDQFNIEMVEAMNHSEWGKTKAEMHERAVSTHITTGSTMATVARYNQQNIKGPLICRSNCGVYHFTKTKNIMNKYTV